MTESDFKALCIKIDHNLRGGWEKDIEYLKDSYIKSDGTYVVMGRHMDMVGKIQANTPDHDLPRRINNAIVERFHINMAHYVWAWDDSTPKMALGGFYCTDSLASKMFMKVADLGSGSIEEKLDTQISEFRKKAKNLTNKNLLGALRELWHGDEDVMLIAKEKIDSLAEVGQIAVVPDEEYV